MDAHGNPVYISLFSFNVMLRHTLYIHRLKWKEFVTEYTVTYCNSFSFHQVIITIVMDTEVAISSIGMGFSVI